MTRLNSSVTRAPAPGLLAAAALSTLAAHEPIFTLHAVVQGFDVHPAKQGYDTIDAKAGATKKVYGGEHGANKKGFGQGMAKKAGAGLTHVSHHLAQTGAAGTKHNRAWKSC